MSTSTVSPPSIAERQWFIVGRWQEYEGEARANLLRVIGVAAFYAVEMANYYGLDLGVIAMPKTVERPFHLAMTFLTVGWAMLCLAVLYCRKNNVLPFWLKYVSTGCDLLLLTTVLALADGPKSALLVGYFLILVLAALRFNLPLIWAATIGAAAGYLFLLGFVKWGKVEGWHDKDLSNPPRSTQVIFLLALVLTGVILGQIIRRVRHLAEHYASRLESARGGQS